MILRQYPNNPKEAFLGLLFFNFSFFINIIFLLFLHSTNPRFRAGTDITLFVQEDPGTSRKQSTYSFYLFGNVYIII